jgi:hypothetical protein
MHSAVSAIPEARAFTDLEALSTKHTVMRLLLAALALALAGCGSHRNGVAACQAAQLRVSQGRNAVGLGNRLEEIVFTNVGATPCRLQGYPRITAHGRPVHALRGGTYFGRLIPAVLQPGGHGFLDFGTANGTDCGENPRIFVRYRKLVFTLPNGGRVPGGRVSIVEHCSQSISELRRPEPPR